MAINLAKRTDINALLPLVSVYDPAIDWDACDFPGDTNERKRMYYAAEVRDPTRLKLFEGEELTVFLFRHPRRADVQEQYHNIQFGMLAGMAHKYSALTFGVVNAFLVGSKTGQTDRIENAHRDKDGNLTPEYVQGLVDNDLVNELSAQFNFELKKPIATNEKK